MRYSTFLLLVSFMALFVLGQLETAQGAIVISGNIVPPYVDPYPDPWNVGGQLTIAETSDGSMMVDNGSDVIDTIGCIGYSNDTTGTVTVDGAGSSWTNSGSLYVGRYGSGILTIQNGGSVCNTTSRLGYWSGGNGKVSISGSQSTWECTGDLWLGNPSNTGVGSLFTWFQGKVYVGDAASSSAYPGFWFIVSDSDGSGASGGHLYIYNGSTLDQCGNAMVGGNAGEYGWATVDGTGSCWFSSDFSVGSWGSGTVTVQNGGSISSGMGWLGYASNGMGTVTVDGTGSSWTCSGWLEIGTAGSGTLAVQNGGSVSSSTGWLGSANNGTGTVTVDGADSTWECTGDLSLGNLSASGVGSLTISDGGTLWIGDAASNGGSTGWLTISDANSSGTDGGNLYIYNGSTLVHSGSVIVGDEAGEYGWATIDGTGSSWTNSVSLVIGYNGSGTLTLQNGASLYNGGGLLVGTYGPGIATVQNGGYVSNAESVYVGMHGSGTLTIQNGGRVSNTDGWLGYETGGIGTVTINGNGSTWENTEDLSLGNPSADSIGSLVISDGGTVWIGDAASDGTAGWLTVSDADGSGNDGGQLFIYNGSTLDHGGSSVLGNDAGEHGWATIEGAGSSWTNKGLLYIGNDGAGRLNIQNRGSVSNTSGWIGCAAGGSGMVTVDGADSTWENTEDLSLGRLYRSGVGSLTISNGGTVWVGDGARSGGRHCWLTVSDTDSSGSAGGHLDIYNGGTLNHGDCAVVGDDTGECGWATVYGTGSSWSNDADLLVGYQGSGTLTVQDGGSVSNTDGWLGYETGGTGTIAINGKGSSWENTSDLSLGRSSNSGVGSLTISGGSTVCVGGAASGAGLAGWLTISDSDGSGTAGGHLNIFNGSTLNHDGGGVVGYGKNESGWVTVDGHGSSWANGEKLYVGLNGAGTLTITDGGLVSVANTLTIDSNGGDDSFINMATGGMLALFGDAHESLAGFLNLIDGTDAIRYWNDSISAWAAITSATYGKDYILSYLTEGDLVGYTMLTVGEYELGGDFDKDGDVDGADFLIWQRGESPNPLSPSDLATWQASFGTVTSAITHALEPVPEPATGFLLMLLMLGLKLKKGTGVILAMRIAFSHRKDSRPLFLPVPFSRSATGT